MCSQVCQFTFMSRTKDLHSCPLLLRFFRCTIWKHINTKSPIWVCNFVIFYTYIYSLIFLLFSYKIKDVCSIEKTPWEPTRPFNYQWAPNNVAVICFTSGIQQCIFLLVLKIFLNFYINNEQISCSNVLNLKWIGRPISVALSATFEDWTIDFHSMTKIF